MNTGSYWHLVAFDASDSLLRNGITLPLVMGGNGSSSIIVCVSSCASLMELPSRRTVKPDSSPGSYVVAISR